MRQRDIWVERTAPNKYVISAESHDGYVYYADTFDKLIEMYESDFQCKVGKVYEYER